MTREEGEEEGAKKEKKNGRWGEGGKKSEEDGEQGGK